MDDITTTIKREIATLLRIILVLLVMGAILWENTSCTLYVSSAPYLISFLLFLLIHHKIMCIDRLLIAFMHTLRINVVIWFSHKVIYSISILNSCIWYLMVFYYVEGIMINSHALIVPCIRFLENLADS
jgi:hypothetical protein